MPVSHPVREGGRIQCLPGKLKRDSRFVYTTAKKNVCGGHTTVRAHEFLRGQENRGGAWEMTFSPHQRLRGGCRTSQAGKDKCLDRKQVVIKEQGARWTSAGKNPLPR